MYNPLTDDTTDFVFTNGSRFLTPSLDIGWEMEVQLFYEDGRPVQFETTQQVLSQFPEFTCGELYAHCLEIKLPRPVKTGANLFWTARDLISQVITYCHSLGVKLVFLSTTPVQCKLEFNPGDFYQKIVSEVFPSKPGDFQAYGTHLHVNCPSGELALWTHNQLYRKVWPFLWGLTLNAPFHQGVYSGKPSIRQALRRKFVLSGDPRRFPDTLEQFKIETEQAMSLGVTPSIRLWTGSGPHPRLGTLECTDFDNCSLQIQAAIAEILQMLIICGTFSESPLPEISEFMVVRNALMIESFGSQAQVFWDGTLMEYRVAILQLLGLLLEKTESAYAPSLPLKQIITDHFDQGGSLGERLLPDYSNTSDIFLLSTSQLQSILS